MQTRKLICLAIVAPDPARLEECVDAVRKQGFLIVAGGSVKAIFAETDCWRTDIPRPSLFALVGVPPKDIPSALDEVRCHPLTAAAPILVVDETLTVEQAAALLNAGVLECWTRPFLAPMFSARVRGALRQTAPR